MLRNQLLVAVRHLLRYKVYSAINIFGLAIGLSASAMIYTWVCYEYSFDRHHENGDRIYRVVREERGEDGSLTFYSGMPGPVAPALQDRFPGIEEAVRLWPKRVWVQFGKKGFDQIACLADSNLLRVFSLTLTVGDPAVALAEPNAIIISKSMAAKFFGDENPIGRILDLQDSRYFTGEYRVSAIMRDITATSSYPFQFDCVFATLPLTGPPRAFWRITGRRPWTFQSFLLVHSEASTDALTENIQDSLPDFLPEGMAAFTRLHLQPLDRVHLYSTTDFPNLRTGSIDSQSGNYGSSRTVYFLSTASLLILFIAAINFVNLTTARATRRAREVGVRKAVGAPRSQLIRQYLLESVLTAVISGVLAIGLIELGVRIATLLFELPPGVVETSGLPLILLPTCVIVGLIAGSYPALYLSGFNPVRVLKGSTQTGTGRSKARGGLVLTQFAISILLLIGTFTVMRQMRFVLKKDLGFEMEHVILTDIFRRDPDRTLLRRYDVVKGELLKNPDVLSATGYKVRIGLGEGETRRIRKGDSDESLLMGSIVIDEDFLHTMGVRLLMGRNLDRLEDALLAGPGRPRVYDGADPSVAILLNESAVRRLGWDQPLGKALEMAYPRTSATVVGVVEDFHIGDPSTRRSAP